MAPRQDAPLPKAFASLGAMRSHHEINTLTEMIQEEAFEREPHNSHVSDDLAQSPTEDETDQDPSFYGTPPANKPAINPSFKPAVQIGIAKKKKKRKLIDKDKLSFTRNDNEEKDDNGHNDVTARKKQRKPININKLSFALDGDEEKDENEYNRAIAKHASSVGPNVPSIKSKPQVAGPPESLVRRLGPNPSIPNAPRMITKKQAALDEEKAAAERAVLAKQLEVEQEQAKATTILIPFVFFDGQEIPAGSIKVKKGDTIGKFLYKAREMALREPRMSISKKPSAQWVYEDFNDLLFVRSGIIIPWSYTFWYFIYTKKQGFRGRGQLFDFSPDPTTLDETTGADSDLEGADHDPRMTKVVDKFWFDENKHVFPVCTWLYFNAAKDFSTMVPRDAHGNTFFYEPPI